MSSFGGVPYPGKKICYWICHLLLLFIVFIFYGWLPACFSNTRDKSFRSHLPESDPADAELPHVASRASCQLASVAESDRTGVAWQQAESHIITVCFQSGSSCGVFLYKLGTLYLTGFH